MTKPQHRQVRVQYNPQSRLGCQTCPDEQAPQCRPHREFRL
ncbi:hypothetical protein [Eubacterium sp.]